MIRNKKKNKIMILLILLLMITVGYAVIATTLKIEGIANVTKQTWNVYWDVPVVTTGSVSDVAPTRTQDAGDPANTKLTWSVDFDIPGDFYEFTVDAVNAGTIDAMVTGINSKVNGNSISTLPEYIKYSVTYGNGKPISENHLLSKANGNNPTTQKYKVRVYYDETASTADIINSIPEGGVSYTFTFDVTYGQANGNAISTSTFTLPSGKTKDTLEFGDEICVKDQCFNFIRYDGNNVVMLAKYNLNVGPNAKGEETFLQDSDVSGGYTTGTVYGTVDFSEENYWNTGNNVNPKYANTDYGTYGADIYDEEYIGAPGTSTYSIAYYVKEYERILKSSAYEVAVEDARLLKLSEATGDFGCTRNPSACPSGFIGNTSFWIGSSTTSSYVWEVNKEINTGNVRININFYTETSLHGVRPVIVVSKSNI